MPFDLAIADYAGPVIESVASAFLKKAFGHAFEQLAHDDRDALEQAAAACLADFLDAGMVDLMEEVEDPARCEDFLRAFADPLGVFLRDPLVRDALLAPLVDAEARPVDGAGLAAHWARLQLPPLPREFSIEATCRAFNRRMRKRVTTDAELRGRRLLSLVEAQTSLLRDLRGAWPDFDLELYARRARERWHALDLSALVPPDRDDGTAAVLRIADVFVAPRAVDRVGEAPKDADAAPVEATPVLDRVAAHPRLVVLGDPGSGKSTLLRWLLLEQLDGRGPFPGRLPLLVELRDYRGGGFLAHLHALGDAQGFGLNAPALEARLGERPSLVLFDGLDEVFDPAERARVAQEIIGFATRWPLARVVVTSRIVGFAPAPWRAAGFHVCALADLDDAQIAAFARGWFALVFRGRPDEARLREERVLGALATPAIRLLAGNPLLLTIIAIIARSRELPRDRARLYEHAVRVLCHHWDVQKHVPVDLDEERKLALLRRVATRMQEDLAGNTVAEDVLLDEIRGFLHARAYLPMDAADRKAGEIVRRLRERSFVLCRRGDAVYGFVHRTFLEFCCAWAVVLRFEKERTLDEDELTRWALDRAEDDPWREVLRLVCGMLDPVVAGRLVDRLVDVDVLAAVECLGEIRDLPAIEATCDRVVGAALQEGDDDCLRALARYGRRLPNRLGHGGWLLRRVEARDWIDEGIAEVAAALWGDDPGLRDAVAGSGGRDYAVCLLLLAFAELPDTEPLLATRRQALRPEGDSPSDDRPV